MKKKQTQQRKQANPKQEAGITLGDMLNQDLLKQLKETQQELKNKEQKQKEAEEQRKHEERRLKEKNKSFEELFNESNMDWKKYK